MPMGALKCFPTEFDGSMMLFASDGSLAPGDFLPSRIEFEARFVNTGDLPRRTAIYGGWSRHRMDLLHAGVPGHGWQLLDGSFTTTKTSPGDIDIAVEVPVLNVTAIKGLRMTDPVLALLQGPLTKTTYHCDAYPIYVLPISDAAYAIITEKAIEYWTKWFGTSRTGTEKGRVWAHTGGLT